jgi:hypothetical protein
VVGTTPGALAGAVVEVDAPAPPGAVVVVVDVEADVPRPPDVGSPEPDLDPLVAPAGWVVEAATLGAGDEPLRATTSAKIAPPIRASEITAKARQPATIRGPPP